MWRKLPASAWNWTLAFQPVARRWTNSYKQNNYLWKMKFNYRLLQELELYINKKATLISSSCENKWWNFMLQEIKWIGDDLIEILSNHSIGIPEGNPKYFIQDSLCLGWNSNREPSEYKCRGFPPDETTWFRISWNAIASEEYSDLDYQVGRVPWYCPGIRNYVNSERVILAEYKCSNYRCDSGRSETILLRLSMGWYITKTFNDNFLYT